jgi:group I intron endonuclease
MAIIYICKNKISNKVYIGITIRPLQIRQWEHTKELNNGDKGGLWQEDFILFGKDSFIYSILEDNVPLESILEKENQYILQFNSLYPNGYNKKLNGSTKGIKMKEYLTTSKYSYEELHNILVDILSISPYNSIHNLSKKYNTTETAIQDIIRCKSYTWLQFYFNEDYTRIIDMHNSGIERKTYLERYKFLEALSLYLTKVSDDLVAFRSGLTTSQVRDLVRGKAYNWAYKEFPKEYELARSLYESNNIKKVFTIIDTTNQEEFSFSSNTEIATILDIDPRRISDLVSGSKKYICNNRYTLVPALKK